MAKESDPASIEHLPTAPMKVDRTLINWFWDDVDRHPDHVALRYRDAGQWCSLTWRAYGESVNVSAAGLRSLGVQPGDRVALFGDNRPEWHIADLAIMALGAISVPIYPTSAPAQVVHVIVDSGASVLITDTVERSRTFATVRANTPDLAHVIAFDPQDEIEGPWDHTWHQLKMAGAELRPTTEPGMRIDETAGSDVATIVYTSGTTGPAKGVALTHDNISFTVTSVASLASIGPTDRMLSFLPLSHIAERVVSHFGQIFGGSETWFASSLATMAEDLKQCRPTIFFAVPRIWQKMHQAIIARVGDKGPRKQMFDRFVAVGLARLDEHQRNLVIRIAHTVEWKLLNLVIGTTVRKALGLDAARHVVSGAAPIDPALVGWFHAIGLPIGQVYGQTEDCGPATLATWPILGGRRDRLGSSGRPIPGVEVRTLPDGELLVRGASVCQGYWRNPQATHDLIDGEGWLHGTPCWSNVRTVRKARRAVDRW
jgi:long-chain acyl-CoA synthetase